MIFKARVKSDHLLTQHCSAFKNCCILLDGTTASCSGECATHLQHNFRLQFFYSKIRNEKFRNISQKISSHIYFIGEVISILHLGFVEFGDSTTKFFKNPFKYFLAIVGDFKNGMVVGINIARTCGLTHVVANKKTSLSIYKSRQIGKIKSCHFRQIIRFKLRHKSPFVWTRDSLNVSTIKVTLNDLTRKPRNRMRKSELCGNAERMIRRGCSAIFEWSVGVAAPKVTECLNESARLLAQNLGQTIDELTRDVLNSTSSVIQCSNGVNGNTPTEITKADIDAAVISLLGADAEMISEVIPGRDMFGTAPIRPGFFGYMDSALLDDLEAVSNFISSAQYPSNMTVMDAEWGSTGNVRWLYTSVGAVSSASPAVYSNFIVGKEAYACVHLGSEAGEFYVEQLGSAGSADPLHQRGSVGWKQPYVARILNDAFMVNLTATHS